MVNKIISGGQTGVDQAALDVAIKLGISHGGWVPRGRMKKDFAIFSHRRRALIINMFLIPEEKGVYGYRTELSARAVQQLFHGAVHA